MPVFYVDGQSIGNQQKGQPRQAKIAVVYREEPGTDFRIRWQEIGDKTNNEAEYHALLKALSIIRSKWAETREGVLPRSVGPIKIYSDSRLIVNQVKGEYDVKDEKLQGLREKARDMMEGLGPVTVGWVPREKNLAGQYLENKWQDGIVETDRDP